MSEKKAKKSKPEKPIEKIKCRLCNSCFPHECHKYIIEGKTVYIGDMHLRNIDVKKLKFKDNHLVIEKKK